jgi:hypothetical protein
MHPVAVVVLALGLVGCTELASPTRWYMGCYDTTAVLVTHERMEDAYCHIPGFPIPICTVGDTVDLVRLDMTRPECAFAAPNEWSQWKGWP